MKTKKLLPPDEQSLLLVSLLFARRHLDEIYSFFSEEQCERMNEAKTRFLRLEQAPRVTQMILQLRRLLLIKENNFRWIHPTWFEYELDKEPPYLRAIIEPALRDQTTQIKASDNKSAISTEQVLQTFLTSFLNTPQRVALFDPVLMRLQSLDRGQQHHVITSIGRHGLSALAQVLDQRRFNKYIQTHFVHLKLEPISNISENPLIHAAYKQLLLATLISLRKKPHRDLAIEFGLWLIAIYLLGYKHSWHRMIEFVLERPLGMGLREKLKFLASSQLEAAKTPVTKLLIDAMDKALNT